MRLTFSIADQQEAMEDGPMLAEKFFLMLETLISREPKQPATYPDGAPKVKRLSQFVPVKLQDPK
jgi:hypothetical protein